MNIAFRTPTTATGLGNYSPRANKTTSSSVERYSPSASDFITSFYAVLRRWNSETSFLSNPDDITSHPSFLAIVKNAKLITPLIIRELIHNPSLLVWALDDAYDVQPYSDDEIGNITAMSEAWIAWAEDNNEVIR